MEAGDAFGAGRTGLHRFFQRKPEDLDEPKRLVGPTSRFNVEVIAHALDKAGIAASLPPVFVPSGSKGGQGHYAYEVHVHARDLQRAEQLLVDTAPLKDKQPPANVFTDEELAELSEETYEEMKAQSLRASPDV